MDKSHHPDFLKIIDQHNVEYSQNRSGSFITLNLLDEETLKKIENHINLINTQNKDFENVETIKKNIEDNYPNLKTTEWVWNQTLKLKKYHCSKINLTKAFTTRKAFIKYH